MNVMETVARRSRAAVELAALEGRSDAAQVVNSLSDGLTTLRNLLFERIHHDVEERFGMDSMLAPVSEEKCEERMKAEIETYQVAVVAEEASVRGYIEQETAAFAAWLACLRLGDHYTTTHYSKTLAKYLPLERKQRRRQFEATLERCLREVSKAPLVLFRLFPLSVRIATCLAFRDPLAAAEWRNLQITWQPAIEDCHDCHGRLLDNSEVCRQCGNPVWRFDWLREAE